MVIPSTPGLPLFWRTRFHALTRFSRLHTSINCSVKAGLSSAGFATDGSVPWCPRTGVSPWSPSSKASEYWIVCRVPVMSPSPTCHSHSFGPLAIVSGSAYLLLRLSALECLTSLADGLACRVGGGALDCSRAGLRPPLKLGVQFSRTQLSRRRSSLSGDGRDHRNQIHKPVLAVELTAWQRSPTAAAPLVVPVRPDPPHQPSVEPVEELSDLGPLVVEAPTTHDGIDLLYQLPSGHRWATSCEPTNLLLEVVDRFLSGIGIERSPPGTRLDLACRQVHGPAPSLDLVPEKFEAVPNVHNPRLLRVNGHAQLLQDATCRL